MMKTVRIGKAFEFVRNGISVKQNEDMAGVPITRIETIWNGEIDSTRFGYAGISENALGKYEEYLLKDGDILMSHINSWKHLAKNALFRKNGQNIIHGMNLLCLRPKQEFLFPTFAKYYFDSPFFKTLIPKIANQSVNQSSFSAGNLKELDIPLPSLKIQQKIAAILDEADRLRRLNKKLIKKYEQLSQSLFLEMFGEMEYYTIQNLIEEKIILVHKDGNYGGMYPRKKEFGEIGVPFLTAKNIDDNGNFILDDVPKLNFKKANKLTFGWIEKGDVLLSHNASVGKVAHYKGLFEKALIGTSLTCFRTDPTKLHPTFLANAFRNKKFQRELFKDSAQTTRNQVPITAQKQLKIPLPLFKEQTLYAERVEEIEKQKAMTHQALEQSEELFNSLLKSAFKGELVKD